MTPSSGDWCSIQLSYTRTRADCMAGSVCQGRTRAQDREREASAVDRRRGQLGDHLLDAVQALVDLENVLVGRAVQKRETGVIFQKAFDGPPGLAPQDGP